ncbi:MAG TPA: protein translocase subunit SecF [archaeon]|nr:protein translocase subunit SecF [archaeon]
MLLKRKKREEESHKPRGEKGRDYRPLLIISIILVVFSVGILVNGYLQSGEWFLRSIELRGGTVIRVSLDSPVQIKELESKLAEKFGSVIVQETRGFGGYGISIEVDSSVDSTQVLSELNANGINTERSSVASIDPAIGASFWSQAQIAVMLAFLFMAITIFVIFRTFVPSTAVILAAGCDIIETVAFMQIFGIELSLASLAALLMLIGYSVDTDIILTTRVLKTTGHHVDERIKSAMKTGLTTAGTTIGALTVLYLSSVSPVLSQIASVLLIGLVLDIANTWIQNAAIIKWYAVRKGI